ncbi:alpha/beta hydrolase fold domain-containing protein [Cellulomonas soli]
MTGRVGPSPRPEEPLIAADTVDGPAGPVPVRVYTPAEPSGVGFVWAHGGGFTWGDLDMPEAHDVACGLARRGIAVVSVDYHRAPVAGLWLDSGVRPRPGVHAPIPALDVQAAYVWAVSRVPGVDVWALGGASAGGNLAASTALRLGLDGGLRPALVVLAYPTLHAVQPEPSAELRAVLASDPESNEFDAARSAAMYANYVGDGEADVFAAPGMAGADELRSFPPTLVLNSEADALRASGEAFAAALSDAGVAVELAMEAGARHGHLSRPEEAAWTRSLKLIARRLLALTREA